VFVNPDLKVGANYAKDFLLITPAYPEGDAYGKDWCYESNEISWFLALKLIWDFE
jgi:hypothetical protein